MGTDIHSYFEKLSDDGIWTCYPFIPRLDTQYWWEPLTYGDNKNEIVKAMTAFGINDEDQALEHLIKFCETLSLVEAERLYGDNDRVYRDWSIPYEIRSRNYEYFSLLSGIRGNSRHTLQPDGRGLPGDTCREIRREYIRTESDNHNTSWVMLEELFQHHQLANIRNVQFIKSYFENIPDLDFDRIRMVFWYDN